MSLPPLSHVLPPAAMRVLSRARALETTHGGTRLAWHAWGDEHGEPLVLLHGGSGSWTHWVRNVEALADSGRRVLVPDLPGFGDSIAADDILDVDGMVEPVAAGMREVVGSTGFDVAGFSFGAMLGVLIGAANPELIRHLVIAGAPALGLRAEGLKLKDWRHLPDQAARDAVHRENMRILMLHDPEQIDDFSVRLHTANLDRDWVRQRKIAKGDIVARTMPSLRCKVDGIWGARDQLYDGLMDELSALLHAMPNFGELVVLEGAGHWVAFERPQAFNRELLRLLDKRETALAT